MPAEGRSGTHQLRPGEVHLWYALLAAVPDPVRSLDLSAEEWSRADRFRNREDQEAFLRGRGFLRAALGAYLGLPPYSGPLDADSRGKPSLPAGAGLEFSFSRTSGAAMCALGRSSVGIDIERLAPQPDRDGLLAEVCTPREREAYALIPEAERDRAFLRLWVSKEAVLKLEGSGLGHHPRRLEVAPWCWETEAFPCRLGDRSLFVHGFTFPGPCLGALATWEKPVGLQLNPFCA
jgi:4'-phosphopantetheinyl transferase